MRLVLVEWLDSHYVPGWHFDDPLTAPKVCRSVGWLVYEGESAITIAANVADEGEQRSGEWTIPRVAIVRIETIQEPNPVRHLNGNLVTETIPEAT